MVLESEPSMQLVAPEAAFAGRETGGLASEMTDHRYQNLYAKRNLDFQQLARRDPDLYSVLKNDQIDFGNPKAVRQLTKTLLKLDFGLTIDLPDDRLCPPVPNRHNYILWLKELLDSTSYRTSDRKVSGLDVGTGASCIYPLLGTCQRPWYFVGTDIDVESLVYARKNVELNGLQDRIRIVQRQPHDPLIGLDELGVDTIDFVMTNPPFYASEDDMISSAAKKARPAFSACTGALVEMVCDGGEVAFVRRMLVESLALRERVQWYTSMIGKASSVESVVKHLHEHGIKNYAVTEFVQGKRTKRWGIGWSFGVMRPSESAARSVKAAIWKPLLPAKTEAELWKQPVEQVVAPVADRIEAIINRLDLIAWEWDRRQLKGTGRAGANVWSRAWRRKNPSKTTGATSAPNNHSPLETPVFGFLINIEVGLAEVKVTARWIEGDSEPLFESFCGYLRGRLRA